MTRKFHKTFKALPLLCVYENKHLALIPIKHEANISILAMYILYFYHSAWEVLLKAPQVLQFAYNTAALTTECIINL